MKTIKLITLPFLITIGMIFISCGDDDMEDDSQEPTQEASLTIDGTTYEIGFLGDDLGVNTTSTEINGEDVTTVIVDGTTADGANFSINLTFGGASTGTYTLNDSGNATPGVGFMSITITQGTQVAKAYNSENVTFNVTAFGDSNVQSFGFLKDITANFSGTVQDRETQENVSLSNGRLSVVN